MWIRPEGRGTFLESSVIKDFINLSIEKGMERFVIDLEACSGMDSTFMGMLMGFGLQFRRTGTGSIKVVGTTPKTLASLRELGLHHIIEIAPTNGEWIGREDEVRADLLPVDLKAPADLERHIREAHESLCVADERNIQKFETVLEMTGSDLVARKAD